MTQSHKLESHFCFYTNCFSFLGIDLQNQVDRMGKARGSMC